MADELLPYYEKELAFIRQMGAEFSKENPKIAGRLGINSDTIEDPHVSRLIESFAYLNAKTQHKLDDDFPELSDALLSVLFPHYQAPIPAMSIVQFTPDAEQLESCYTIPGNTLLETGPFQGERCLFTSRYPIDLIPVKVTSASLMGRPFTTPGSDDMKGAKSVLKISLETLSAQIKFSELKPEKLRFYLKGQAQHINPLYQLLLKDCNNVVMSLSDADTSPVFMGKESIQAVGFSADEGLLPYPPSSFIGYRLLTEYFAFPEKFIFIDIIELAEKIPKNAGNTLDLYIYLNTSNLELEHNISAQTFAMGCTPVINLFEHRTDPIKLDHTQQDYKIIPDARRPLGYEVYSVDRVSASTSAGHQEEFHPVYGLNHEHQESDCHSFWFTSRQNAKLCTSERDEGSHVFISFIDLNFNPNLPEGRTINIESTCSNRDLPNKLPFTVDKSGLQCVDSSPPCSNIAFLFQPGVTIRPPLRNHARWRLISHLNLNHLSITGGDDAAQALKEILRLYDFNDSASTRALIESIEDVNAKPISAPLNIDGRNTLCRGFEVTVVLDGRKLAGSSTYLFATVLEHFFSLYCSINSFTRVLIKLKNKEGYLKKCPPRSGEKILL